MAWAKSDKMEGRLGLSVLTLLALIILVFGRSAAQDRRSEPMLTADIQAPVAALISRPFRAVETAIATREERRQALEENRVLRRELAELRRERDRSAAMAVRLERLEATLGIRVNGEIPGQHVTARLVSDPGSPFVRSFLLSAGAQDGVASGHAVMSEAGLVGHVLRTGQNSARVLRLDDLNSRIAVMSERSGARAIMVGTNEGAPSLRFISDIEGWQVGDAVITSGDDGQLPMGLPVGDVIEGDRVSLAYQRKPVDWVIVLPFSAVANGQDVDAVSLEGEATIEALVPEADGEAG